MRVKTDTHTALRQRLDELGQCIDLDEIASRDATDARHIARYYRLNRIVYHVINSTDGFVHMGISRDGVFKTSDFWEQGRMIAGLLEKHQAHDVLELAAGKAATTKYLATHFPQVQFTGLDLPHGQLQTAATQANLTLTTGDYHNLRQFKSDSFDVVYIIEALCHARDKQQVTQEVFRILKPNGLFIIFDGYNTKTDEQMDATETYASRLLWKSMMVGADGHHYQTFRQMLTREGFDLIDEENLTQYVLPSMRRLERRGRRFLSHPRFMKIFAKLMPKVMTSNLVAAHLFPVTCSSGVHQYWFSVAQKKTSAK